MTVEFNNTGDQPWEETFHWIGRSKNLLTRVQEGLGEELEAVSIYNSLRIVLDLSCFKSVTIEAWREKDYSLRRKWSQERVFVYFNFKWEK